MGFLAALAGGGGGAAAGGAGAAGAGAGAAGTGAAAGGSTLAGLGSLTGAAPATSAAGPATAASAFGGMGAPGTVMGAGNAGLMQQIMQGMSQYGGGVLNPGKGQAGTDVFGALNQGQLPKFSDAVKYATQLALNDALFGRRKQLQQGLGQYNPRR